jgi:hypothetical protein
VPARLGFAATAAVAIPLADRSLCADDLPLGCLIP